MKMLSMLLAATLLMSGCTTSKAWERPKDAPKPQSKAEVTLKIEFYKTHEEVKAVCEPTSPWSLSGCAIPYLSNGKKTGQWLLLLVEPESWCDWDALKTAGHELMHTLGYEHSEKHLFRGGRIWWEADECQFTKTP